MWKPHIFFLSNHSTLFYNFKIKYYSKISNLDVVCVVWEFPNGGFQEAQDSWNFLPMG